MNFFSLTCEKGVRTWEANQQNEINVMAHRILIDNLDAVSRVALDGGFCYKGKAATSCMALRCAGVEGGRCYASLQILLRVIYFYTPAKQTIYSGAQGAAKTARIAQMINTYDTIIIT